MEIGEDELAFAQPLAFDRLRLLALHDHLGRGEDLLRRAHDLRAGLTVTVVADIDRCAGPGLDDHLMAVMEQLADGPGRQSAAVLVTIDLPGPPNNNTIPQSPCPGPRRRDTP